MESYVEVDVIYNGLCIVTSVLIASYSCVKPIKVNKVIGYASVISLVGVSLYQSYSYLVMLLLEVLFFITLFRHKQKVFLYAMALRWFFSFSCFAMVGGSFHNGLYFISVYVNPFPLFLLLITVLYFLKRKWRDLFAKSNYVYEVTLTIQEQQVSLKAYLDSGNLLCHHAQPVLFLDEKYQTYFSDSNIELVVMNTIDANGILRCHPCLAQVEGCKTHRVYVSCYKALSLPFDCDALLNMKLMTLG